MTTTQVTGNSSVKNWLGDTLDRTWRTGLQVLAAYLSVAQTVHEVDWTVALLATLFAMLLSLLTRLIDLPSLGDAWYWQVAERLVKTFVQSLLVMIGAATAFDQVDWGMALNTALMAAIYSIVTSVLTTRAGTPESRGSVDLTVPPEQKVVVSASQRASGAGGF